MLPPSHLTAAIAGMLSSAFPQIHIKPEPDGREVVRESFRILPGESETEVRSACLWERRTPFELVYYAAPAADPRPACDAMARNLAALILGGGIRTEDEAGETVIFAPTELRHGIVTERQSTLLYVHFTLTEQGPPDVFIPAGEDGVDGDLMQNLHLEMEA